MNIKNQRNKVSNKLKVDDILYNENNSHFEISKDQWNRLIKETNENDILDNAHILEFDTFILDYIKDSITPYGKLLFLTHSGSKLYGTSNENSDDDYIGVYLMPLENRISLYPNKKTIDLSIGDKDRYNKNTKNAIDITIYELEYFFRLLIKSNPNMIELLFTDTNPDAIIYIDDLFKPILEKKMLFLSEKIKSTFYGYAYSQFKRANKPHPNYKQLSTSIRVLKSGIEILETNNLSFPLKKALFYKEIKEGKFNIDKLIPYIEQTLDVFKNLKIHFPKNPDIDKINQLYFDIAISYVNNEHTKEVISKKETTIKDKIINYQKNDNARKLKEFFESFLIAAPTLFKSNIKINNNNIYFTATNTYIDIEKYDDHNYDLVVGNKQSHIRININPNNCTYFTTYNHIQDSTYSIEFSINNDLKIKIFK